jgi:hypothetical protein
VIALELLPERICSTCTSLKKRTYGCETDATQILELDGVRLLRCPRRPLLDDPQLYGEVFWLYRSYKKGYLPNSGGLDDQPAKYMAYVKVIDRALDFCQQEADAREKAKMKKPIGR